MEKLDLRLIKPAPLDLQPLDLQPIPQPEKPKLDLQPLDLQPIKPQEPKWTNYGITTPKPQPFKMQGIQPTQKLDLQPLDLIPIPKKKYTYGDFVNTLSQIQSGARGVVAETIGALQDPKSVFDPIERFRKSLKNEEYVTAEKVFKDIPDGQTRSLIGNMLINAPKEAAMISLDILTDPSMYIGGGLIKGAGKLAKLAKLDKAAASAVSKFTETPAGQKLREWFVYRGNQPKAYRELAEERVKQIQLGQEKGAEIGRGLQAGLTPGQQERAGQILRGGVSVSEREAPLRAVVEPARAEFTRLGKEAVRENLLSEKTFMENIKSYMPRKYTKWELENKKNNVGFSEYFGYKPLRIKGESFIRRQDIPEEVRLAMGEIRKPAYPVARGIAKETHDIETAKLFNDVASNPAWVSDAPRLGYTLLKENKKLGALSNKYVIDSIAKDVDEIVRIPDTTEKIYNSFLSKWKFAKVVANPATHFRNLMSNTILLERSGVDPIRIPKLISRSARELSERGKYYSEAKSAGLLGHEFYGTEIKGFLSAYRGETPLGAMANVIDKFKSAGDKMGKVYQAEEQLFKMAKYIEQRDAGRTVKEAVKQAEEWLFNYEKVPKFIEYARKSPLGAPFITFTSKAIPALGKSAVKDPMGFYRYISLFKAIENRAKAELGLTDEEITKIKQSRRGVHIILPQRDEFGKVQTLDVSYVLPWGDIGETGGMFGMSPSLSPSNPLFKALAELGTNKSSFTGREIWDEKTDTRAEKARKVADYLGKNLVPLPSWAPPGYSWNKIVKAIEKQPDYYGRVRGIPKIILDTIFGVKISPVDMDLIARQEHNEISRTINDLQSERRYYLSHRGIPGNIKETKSKEIDQKIKNAIENRKSIGDYIRLLSGGGNPFGAKPVTAGGGLDIIPIEPLAAASPK